MRYYFKEYLRLPVLNFWKDSNASIFMTTIWKLYSLSFTNQRAYYYKESDLSYEDKTSIFSIEGINKTFWFLPWYWYQRRTSDKRLRDIAKYLITAWEELNYQNSKKQIEDYITKLWQKSFFPNNIIVSMNNEKYHNFDIHELYLMDKKNTNHEDKSDFEKYLKSEFWTNEIFLDNNQLNTSNKDIELCRIQKDEFEDTYKLLIPIFEIFEETTENELLSFVSQSLIYNWGDESDLDKIKEQERFYKIAWIIDGQHRTMSLKFLDEQIKELRNSLESDLVIKVEQLKSILDREYNEEMKKYKVATPGTMKLKEELDKKKQELDNINLELLYKAEEIRNNVLGTNISVTSFMKSTIEDQANIFIDINNNAKPVDKSLTYDLLPLTENSQSIELAAKKLFDDFNKDPGSPFYKFIYNIRSQDSKNMNWDEIQKILSQANFINEIKTYFKISRSTPKIFNSYFKEKNLTPVYWLIYWFFDKINKKYINDMLDENWEYDDKKYALYRTTWFWSLLQLMISIIEDIKKNSWWELIDGFNKESFYNSSNPINVRFSEIIDILYGEIQFTRSQLSSFRWKWWQNDLVKIMKIFVWLDSINNYEWEEKKKIENQMNLFT